MPGRGTQCPGPVDKVGIGQRLGSVVLEIFSNLSDSGNLGFTSNHPVPGFDTTAPNTTLQDQTKTAPKAPDWVCLARF